MNKHTLRSLFLEKRKTLSEEEFQKRNSLVFDKTLRFIKSNTEAQNYHIFLSISKFNEPDTQPIFQWLLNSSQHRVFLPKTNFKAKKLTHFEVAKNTKIEANHFGIPEPQNGKEANPTDIDIVFVPLISFDKKGNRIGYGAGLYDRFLSQIRPDCLKVGISISSPLDNIDYTDAHDVPLDYCINHYRIHDFTH